MSLTYGELQKKCTKVKKLGLYNGKCNKKRYQLEEVLNKLDLDEKDNEKTKTPSSSPNSDDDFYRILSGISITWDKEWQETYPAQTNFIVTHAKDIVKVRTLLEQKGYTST